MWDNAKMRKSLIVLGTIFVLLLMFVFIYLLFPKKNNSPVSPLSPTSNTDSLFPNPSLSPAPEGEYNVLLLGQGGAGHPGGILTDSMMVIHLNTATKSASLIFIPRDLWVNKMKINEAYSKAGFALAKEMVSSITGLPIQFSVVIDFPNFIRAIDSLGGIDVSIAKAFDDYFYPVAGKELEICGKSAEEVATLSASLSGFELEKQFTCRYEHLHFEAGKIHLDGTTALKLARSRHSTTDGSDFARGGRQQLILIAIKDKLLSLQALKNIDKFFDSFSKLVKTDLDSTTVKIIVSLIINHQEYKINQIVPSDTNVLKSSNNSSGQFILLPKAGDGNWQDFQDFIRKQM